MSRRLKEILTAPCQPKNGSNFHFDGRHVGALKIILKKKN